MKGFAVGAVFVLLLLGLAFYVATRPAGGGPGVAAGGGDRYYDQANDRTEVSVPAVHKDLDGRRVMVSVRYSYKGTIPAGLPTAFQMTVAVSPTGVGLDADTVPARVEVDGSPLFADGGGGREASTTSGAGQRVYVIPLRRDEVNRLAGGRAAEIRVHDLRVPLAADDVRALGRVLDVEGVRGK